MTSAVNSYMSVCRICLQQNQVEIPILFEAPTTENPTLFEKITACLPIKITEEDGLPKKICRDCYESIDFIFTFRRLSYDSAEQLNAMLKNFAKFPDESELIQETEIVIDNVNETDILLDEESLPDELQMAIEIKEVYFNDIIKEYEDNVENPQNQHPLDAIEVRNASLDAHCDVSSKECGSLDGNRISEIVENSNVSLQEWMSKNKDVTDMSTEKFLDMILVKAERKVDGQKEAQQECDKFICSLCNEECATDAQLADHARLQHKAFKCLFCSKIFLQKYMFEKHLYVHSDKRENRCSQCPLSFKRESDLYNHLKRTHAKTTSVIYQCDRCDYVANTRFGIKIHILAHDGRFIYNCDECEKGFNCKVDLRTHKNNHIGFKPFQCDICGNIFTRSTYLKQHRAMVHENPRSFECAICGRCFSLKSTIKNHLKVHFGENKNFTCDICGRNVSSKSALVNHQRIHAGDKRYTCNICNKSYVTKLQVKRHAYIHTGHKPYKCDICQKSLATSSSLIKHLQTHWQNRTLYMCYVCNKSYVTKYKLNSHLANIHSK